MAVLVLNRLTDYCITVKLIKIRDFDSPRELQGNAANFQQIILFSITGKILSTVVVGV